MVAHIIAKAAWQVLQPHAKIAAGHAARGIGSVLSRAAKPAVPPAPLTWVPPASAALHPAAMPGTVLTGSNTHLIDTFGAPTAAAGAAGVAARHGGRAAHGATHGTPHHAGAARRAVHDAGVVAKRLGEAAAAEMAARPVADWAAEKVKDMMAGHAERKRPAQPPGPATC
jgi:hypothetical protein